MERSSEEREEMKASEVIKQLQLQIESFGDIEVIGRNYYGNLAPVESIVGGEAFNGDGDSMGTKITIEMGDK